MRRVLSVLLAISLSWVTTGYACRMDGLRIVRAACCCPHAHEAPKSATAKAKSEKRVGVGDDAPCCKVVAHAALGDQQPGVASQAPTLDLPPFAASHPMPWSVSEPAVRTIATLPPARGPPLGSGTRTYLTTARLRL